LNDDCLLGGLDSCVSQTAPIEMQLHVNANTFSR